MAGPPEMAWHQTLQITKLELLGSFSCSLAWSEKDFLHLHRHLKLHGHYYNGYSGFASQDILVCNHDLTSGDSR